MTKPLLRAVFLHGVGTQGPEFANDARRALRSTLTDRGVASHFASVHWAPLADRVENEFGQLLPKARRQDARGRAHVRAQPRTKG